MRIAATLLILGLAAGSIQAADAPLKGDAAAGATKAAACTACHGLNGNSMMAEWPTLAGQNASYLRDQTQRFRDGHRVNLMMMPMVQGLSDQDIADLAAYFSTQNPNGLEADPSYWQAGQTLYRVGDATRGIPACAACHGPVGRGNPAAGYPALQAQHSVYTVKQLNDYAVESRYTKDAAGRAQAGPNAAMMKEIAQRLTPEDRRDVASYLQGMR
ncbi:MAG TPA: c-type cytochrome [Steroidobacteraceae bacterium]|nr:c-type cytochrome [Steroidobacteraceae bacterium]